MTPTTDDRPEHDPAATSIRPHAARRLHRPRHAVHRRRRPRRGRLPPARPLADPGRDRRARPVRHDRRVPHPVDRRSASGSSPRPSRSPRNEPSRDASASSPGPARTTPRPRSGPPAGRPSSARTPRSSWRPTTTGPTAGCSTPTSGRSPTRATCRSSSTTSRHGPARTSTPTRSCGWPSTRASSRSRRPAAISSRSRGSAATGRATSRSSPATMPGPCRSSRWAATASSPSPPTRSRASSSRCAPPRGPATGMPPGGSTSAGCRCSSATSVAARTRSR